MKATTARRVYLRSAPGLLSLFPLQSIPGGSPLNILESEGEWLRVSVDDKEGYLRRESVEMADSDEKPHYELPEVLLAELREVKRARGAGKEAEEPPLSDEGKEKRLKELFPRLHRAKLSALCLSGGGIRSATFNLGVLQGLSKCGALREIDYLSTVSGGGYIGSWLSSWISRESGEPAERCERVARVLAQESSENRGREPYQVKFLRDYRNYLTPRVGIFSTDTWTIIGTYLRNLLLNWLVLVPLLFAFFLLPRILLPLVSGAVLGELPQEGHTLAARMCVVIGAICGAFPIAYTVTNLPSMGNLKQSKKSFLFRFLLPLLLMACFLSAYWGDLYRPGCPDNPTLGGFLLFGSAVHFVGWAAGVLCLGKRLSKESAAGLACAAITGFLAGLFGWVAGVKLLPVLLRPVQHPKLLYATLSVPAILAVYLLTMALVVAALSRLTEEQDR